MLPTDILFSIENWNIQSLARKIIQEEKLTWK